MKTKIMALMMILVLGWVGQASAESAIDIPYFTKETVKITENIILMPFRLLRDIFDPEPVKPLVLVPPPVMQAAPVVQAAAPAPVPQADPDVVEVQIAKGNGSMIVVPLRKTEKGYMGPQGEFYAHYPSQDVLKEKYLKD